MRIVLAAFDAIGAEERLVVTTDHEALPLRQNLERLLPHRFVWQQRNVGTRHWEITLRHVAASGDPGSLEAFLARCELLCDALPRTRSSFADAAIVRRYERDAAIISSDRGFPYLGFVRSGTVVCELSIASGREQALFDIFPGGSFGVAETLDGGAGIVDVTAAVGAASVILIPATCVSEAAANDSAFAAALATACAQEARRIAACFTAHVDTHAMQRVAATILTFSSSDAGLVAPLDPLGRMTQSELAARSGTAKEVAARAIATLESAGAIVRAKGHIALVDRERLRTLLEEPASRESSR